MKIHNRLTYANVMSTIAVFLVVGGATAFAASQLGKNSVGTKQLKKTRSPRRRSRRTPLPPPS